MQLQSYERRLNIESNLHNDEWAEKKVFGDTKMLRIKRTDKLNDDELDEFYSTIVSRG